MTDGIHNPKRVDGPMPHLSAGRYLVPQRYVIGWPDGVVKIGETWNGKRRWGTFISTGGTMLDLAFYEELGDSSRAETWLQRQVGQTYCRAFATKEHSRHHLGRSGGGWLECFAIPVEHWPAIIELART
jgi:hypothetical protein